MKKILAVIMASMFFCVGCAHKPKPVEEMSFSEQIIMEYKKEQAEKERTEKAKKVFWYITEAGAIAIIGNSLGLDGAIESAILSK